MAPVARRIELVPTEGPYSAGGQAAECAANGSELIVVAGGDGTVNEVIQGVAGTGACLGILPAGTANVLSVETRIGTDFVRAARKMKDFEDRRIALGRFTRTGEPSRYFVAMAGAGLDAQIVRRVSAPFKRRYGKLAYWLAGFGAVGERLNEFEVTMDGLPHKASFALISRVRNYGGDLEIARHASLFSDSLAVVLFEGASSFRYLKYFSGVLLNRLDGMSGVTVTRAQSLSLRPLNGANVDLQVDGEYAGHAPAQFEIVPDALRILLPRRFKG